MLTFTRTTRPKPAQVCEQGVRACIAPWARWFAGQACAMKKVRQNKGGGTGKGLYRKEAIKTIPVLIKEAQVAFNAYIPRPRR